MNRYLLVIALCLHSGYAFSQSDKYFKAKSATPRHFRGAAVGTRKISLTTDFINLALNGTANMGVQWALSKYFGAEIVYGRSIDRNAKLTIIVPYRHNGKITAQTRISHDLQQSFFVYASHMGMRSNAYLGINFWQTFIETTFPRDPFSPLRSVPVTTTRRIALHFMIGSQRTLLGPLQMGWELGLGGYRVSGPSLGYLGISNLSASPESSIGLMGKVKLGYLLK